MTTASPLPRPWIWLAGAAALGGLILLVLAIGREPAGPPPPAPPLPPAPSVVEPDAQPARTPADDSLVPEGTPTSIRTVVPRPAGSPPPAPRAGTDKPPAGQAQIQAFQQRLDLSRAGAEKCLARWLKRQPKVREGLMLGIAVDGSGVQEVWMEGAAAVPQAHLRCLGQAVYGQDWSNLTDIPVTLGDRIRYQAPPGQVPSR